MTPRRPVPPPRPASGTLDWQSVVAVIPDSCSKCRLDINLGDPYLAMRVHEGINAYRRDSFCARCAGALLRRGPGRRPGVGGVEGVA